jgi:hypothetical protein
VHKGATENIAIVFLGMISVPVYYTVLGIVVPITAGVWTTRAILVVPPLLCFLMGLRRAKRLSIYCIGLILGIFLFQWAMSQIIWNT